ncbi:dolichol kinase [Halosegnis marinus]|uniref:Dolichol kinase n=1 Tax=Halosegnis marinus TaxID=3034023 RepID=A0ABD5ZL27_9EURY|nr:dolichol kinase [Halosegnis sp. DT85]
MSELGRRAVHASGAVVPLAYVADVATWGEVRLVATAGLALALLLEALRLLAGFDHALYDRLTREYEQENLAGYALYALSGTAVLWLTEPAVGVPAVLMLALGDPVSGLLSSGELRAVKPPRVLVGMFVVCTALALPFVPPVAAVAGALGATVADGVKPQPFGYVIDDNLTISPLAAGAMLAALALLGA